MTTKIPKTWVVLELTRAGEYLVNEGSLESSLRRDLNLQEDYPIFVPSILIIRRDSTTVHHWLEGYVFIASGLPETDYFGLERTPYVNQVLSKRPEGRLRVLQTVQDADVQKLRDDMQEFSSGEIPEGFKVRVVQGIYQNLEGDFIDQEGDLAFVRVTLRSIDSIITVPRLSLEEIEKSD